MAFSKGKRIEDETSIRIVDLAVNIGCKEGPDALTVTRICKELNCDRRVIYNRFRDIDEINFLVSDKCNEELLLHAKEAIKENVGFFENFKAMIETAFMYIYERNAYFQYYTALYRVNDDGIHNEILKTLTEYIENGKASGNVKEQTQSRQAAEGLWFMMIGISSMLAQHVNYKYQDGLITLKYGVEAICKELQN